MWAWTWPTGLSPDQEGGSRSDAENAEHLPGSMPTGPPLPARGLFLVVCPIAHFPVIFLGSVWAQENFPTSLLSHHHSSKQTVVAFALQSFRKIGIWFPLASSISRMWPSPHLAVFSSYLALWDDRCLLVSSDMNLRAAFLFFWVSGQHHLYRHGEIPRGIFLSLISNSGHQFRHWQMTPRKQYFLFPVTASSRASSFSLFSVILYMKWKDCLMNH